MTETYRLNYRLIKRGLSLDWLIDQIRRRKCNITLHELQDVYTGVKTGAAAEPILSQAMTIIDDYDVWLDGVSA